KSYTVDSAYASRAESIKGSLEARKYADFVVLSEDPTAVPASEISQIQVESTWVGGECRYRAG
ncbi:amidohydrolase family protein, partial [Agrococcus casei]